MGGQQVTNLPTAAEGIARFIFYPNAHRMNVSYSSVIQHEGVQGHIDIDPLILNLGTEWMGVAVTNDNNNNNTPY